MFRWTCWLIMTSIWVSFALFIPNGVPHRDGNGNPIDVHDGEIVKWPGLTDYYWYGMAYGGCLIPTVGRPDACTGVASPASTNPCGFQLNHSIVLYSSPDLLNWTFQGDVLPYASRPVGIYFRPKVVYNANTSMYVLWVNYLNVSQPNDTAIVGYQSARSLVAVSSTPKGPFAVASPMFANIVIPSGDFDILVVNGTQAYVAYHYLQYNGTLVEKLTPDFLGSTGQRQLITAFPLDYEAQAFWAWNGSFWLSAGPGCCFCPEGAGMILLRADSPMGPWTTVQHWGYANYPTDTMTSFARAQQSFVFTFTPPTGPPVLIWAGDQWGLSSDGTKGHTFQYWVPITWVQGANGTQPADLAMVTGWDTTNPLNYSAYLTGFCLDSEVPTIYTLQSNQSAFATLSQPCQACLIRNQATYTVCIPPEYKYLNQSGTCSVAEAIAFWPIIQICIVETVTSCGPTAAAFLATGAVGASCQSCVSGDSTSLHHIPHDCLPASLGYASCSAADVASFQPLVVACATSSTSPTCLAAASYVLVNRMVGATCQSCVATYRADVGSLLTYCFPPGVLLAGTGALCTAADAAAFQPAAAVCAASGPGAACSAAVNALTLSTGCSSCIAGHSGDFAAVAGTCFGLGGPVSGGAAGCSAAEVGMLAPVVAGCAAAPASPGCWALVNLTLTPACARCVLPSLGNASALILGCLPAGPLAAGTSCTTADAAAVLAAVPGGCLANPSPAACTQAFLGVASSLSGACVQCAQSNPSVAGALGVCFGFTPSGGGGGNASAACQGGDAAALAGTLGACATPGDACVAAFVSALNSTAVSKLCLACVVAQGGNLSAVQSVCFGVASANVTNATTTTTSPMCTLADAPSVAQLAPCTTNPTPTCTTVFLTLSAPCQQCLQGPNPSTCVPTGSIPGGGTNATNATNSTSRSAQSAFGCNGTGTCTLTTDQQVSGQVTFSSNFVVPDGKTVTFGSGATAVASGGDVTGTGTLAFTAGSLLQVVGDVLYAVDLLFQLGSQILIAAAGSLHAQGIVRMVSNTISSLGGALLFAASGVLQVAGTVVNSVATTFEAGSQATLDSGANLQVTNTMTMQGNNVIQGGASSLVTFATASLLSIASTVVYAVATVFAAGSRVLLAAAAAALSLTETAQFSGSQVSGAGTVSLSGGGNTITNTVFQAALTLAAAAAANRVDLSGYTTTTFCGASQGTVTLTGNAAAVFQQNCTVASQPSYSSVVSNLAVSSTTGAVVFDSVSSSSLPVSIGTWTNPRNVPVYVDLVPSSNAYTQVVAVTNSSAVCSSQLAATIENCASGYTCSLSYDTDSAGQCNVKVTQAQPSSGSNNDGLLGLIALVALVPLALLGAAAAWYFLRPTPEVAPAFNQAAGYDYPMEWVPRMYPSAVYPTAVYPTAVYPDMGPAMYEFPMNTPLASPELAMPYAAQLPVMIAYPGAGVLYP